MGSPPREPTESTDPTDPTDFTDPTAGLPAAGDVFAGRYHLTRELGRGGMGVVWEAEDAELGRRVAIKMVTGLADPSSLERMRREARAVAKLTHPNVAAIYDVDADGDPPFIVMEFVGGGDLGTWLRSEPRPSWREVLSAFEQAGLGLDAAHRAGLVHRDFKPANVILGGGRVRVVDFGLARAGSRDPVTVGPDGRQGTLDPTLTVRGIGIGTPAYMSPEQHEAAPVSPATDVFAFACSLYLGLYGERPFRGHTMAELYKAKRDGPPSAPPQNSLASEVPARLFPLVVKGLAVDPEARWSAMDEFVEALRRARRSNTPRGLVASVAAAGAVLWVWTGLRPKQEPATNQEQCLRDIEAFNREWTARKFQLVDRLENAGGSLTLSDAVRQSLDDYSEQWTTIARGTCVPQEDARLAEAMTDCLARVRYRAQRQLSRAIASAESSASFPEELEQLTTPEACGGSVLAGIEPMPQGDEEHRALQEILKWVRDDTTTFTSEQLERHLARATEIGHKPTIAELELAAARHTQDLGDITQSMVHCDRAYLAATEGGATWVAFRAADACVIAASKLADVDQARLWAGRQKALSERLRVSTAEHVRRQAHLAAALARGGEVQEARRIAAEAEQNLDDVPSHYKLAVNALVQIGVVGLWLDDYDDALRRLERSHRWAQRFHTDDPEMMAYIESSLATGYRATKRFDEAEVLFERSLARRQDPRQLLVVRLNYALMLSDLPARIPDGLAVLEPARADLVAKGRDGTVEFAHVLAATGQLYVRAGELDKAREVLKAAKSIYLEQLEPEHIRLQMVEQLLAEADAAP